MVGSIGRFIAEGFCFSPAKDRTPEFLEYGLRCRLISAGWQ
jgi:hypothetical protein